MNLAQVLAAIATGKVMSRASWPPGQWIGLRSQTRTPLDASTAYLYQRQPRGSDLPWVPTLEDVTAQDWEPAR